MPRTLPTATALRAMLALLLTGLALVGLAGLGAAPARADDDVSWALRTASNGFGDARQNYAYTVNPDGSVHDGLVVLNHGSAPLALSVYAADGFTTEAGQLDLLPGGAASKGVGAWVHAGQDRIEIPAGQSVEVPFTLDVPANATPGDHMGGIITSLSAPDDTAGITVDRRLAVRIRARVGGALTPKLTVGGIHVDTSGTAGGLSAGSATVSYTVHNTGNAIVSAHQSVQISGPFGLFETKSGPVADTPQLLPGESWQVRVTVPNVRAAARLSASVSLTPIVVDDAGSTAALPVVRTSQHVWALPWAIVGLLVLAAGGVVAIRHARRSRTHPGQPVLVGGGVGQEPAGA